MRQRLPPKTAYNMTTPERATGKRAEPNCIHLEKRINLIKYGHVLKPWPSWIQALPSCQLTGGWKRNRVGREWRPGTGEDLTLEICSGSTNLHFMVL